LNASHVYWEPPDWSLKKEKGGNWKLENCEESLKKKEGRKEGREKTIFLGECCEDWVPRREF
jgi:hypothetical protein